MVMAGRKAFELSARSREALAGMTCWPLRLLLVLSIAAVSPCSMAARQAEDLDATVQYLITYVKQSDVTFERNTRRYTGREAAEHINNKFQHFRDDIDTPEKFIELCASGSLMTGKPYFIITQQGEMMPSGEWLNAELRVYRLRNEQGKR